MLECVQACPEYKPPCERNKRVKSRGTDHGGTENFKSKGKKRNTDIISATKAETDVSRAQYKRTALSFQKLTQNGKNATQTGEAK